MMKARTISTFAFIPIPQSTMQRWKLTALAAAAAAAFGLSSMEASALTLGKITVKSSLGEPLRAEIDVLDISTAEADSLQVKPATANVFRAQGMEHTSTAGSVQMRLQRRANGGAAIVLSTSQPVNEPFVDLVIDASWNAGEVVRSYTMLLDPPSLKKSAPAATTAPQITSNAPLPPVRRQPNAVIAEPLLPPSEPAAAARPQRKAAPIAVEPAAAVAAPDAVRVQRGDTAGRIAAANKPAGVSLDQMLIAMMQVNPGAFSSGNVNRLKAGAVMRMPTTAEAQAISPQKARQMVAAQSRDFGEYRRQLASKATSTQTGTDARSASGKVQATVDDKKAPVGKPDQLTLSKGAIQGTDKNTAEARVAQAETANAAASRTSELDRNIAELNKLKQAAGTPAAAGTTAPAPKPAAEAAATPSASAPAPAAASPADATPAASTTTAPATTPAPSPAAPPPATQPPAPQPAAPAPVEEPSFVDGLLDNPMLLPAGGGLIALLLGLLGWRAYQRRKANATPLGDGKGAPNGNLAPDSFFGADGGEHIDTSASQAASGNSSMAYTPSQLDVGDVDPVAEADVYLAYGRDLQAEEILKEALRHNPTRTALHAKLAEIYAKRKNRLALEALAKEGRQLTQGTGPDWLRISALGLELDPTNGLYQTATVAVPPVAAGTADALSAAAAPIAFEATRPGFATNASAPASELQASSGLDFEISSQHTEGAPPASAKPQPSMADFERQQTTGMSTTPHVAPTAIMPLEPAPAAPAAPSVVPPTAPPTLDFELSGFDEVNNTAQMPWATTGNPPSNHSMDFDLSGLSLDLPGQDSSPTPSANLSTSGLEMDDSDPLATKLALAQEFLAIGDRDGARSLAQEVLAESTSATIKAAAQKVLAEIH